MLSLFADAIKKINNQGKEHSTVASIRDTGPLRKQIAVIITSAYNNKTDQDAFVKSILAENDSNNTNNELLKEALKLLYNDMQNIGIQIENFENSGILVNFSIRLLSLLSQKQETYAQKLLKQSKNRQPPQNNFSK